MQDEMIVPGLALIRAPLHDQVDAIPFLWTRWVWRDRVREEIRVTVTDQGSLALGARYVICCLGSRPLSTMETGLSGAAC